jgi:hypothetical protein
MRHFEINMVVPVTFSGFTNQPPLWPLPAGRSCMSASTNSLTNCQKVMLYRQPSLVLAFESVFVEEKQPRTVEIVGQFDRFGM